MKKIRLVAAREFLTTVSNRGFTSGSKRGVIIGLLIMPALGFLILRLVPRIMNAPGPEIRGDVAVIDPTGRVVEEFSKTLDPSYIKAQRFREAVRRMTDGGSGQS